MNGNPVRSNLLAKADFAFMMLAQQIQSMLELIDGFQLRHPPIDASLRLQHEQLRPCIDTLGSIPAQLAAELASFHAGTPRLLSREGVDLELLAELQATLDSLVLFLDANQEPFDGYNHRLATRSIELLRQVNSQLS